MCQQYISDHYELQGLEFFYSWALYWLALRRGRVRKCLTPFWLLWEAMYYEKNKKAKHWFPKKMLPVRERERERANTICHVRVLPLNHFPVKLRSHCEWDKERGVEIGWTNASLCIFCSNWVFVNLCFNKRLTEQKWEHFSLHNEICERLC